VAVNYGFEGSDPDVDPEASVSDAATLVGDVTIGPDASVWPGAVLRGDMGPVEIGAGTHVEDNCVVHMSTVGERVMVGHSVVLDVATVGDRTLVASNSTINREAKIGERSIVAAGAVVPDQREIPPESFVRGVPATVTPLAETDMDPDAIFDFYSPDVYDDLVERHGDLFE
jgi:carbonic anhydrase/acetyltransferase-like protein (isoleucine patch superfamily)